MKILAFAGNWSSGNVDASACFSNTSNTVSISDLWGLNFNSIRSVIRLSEQNTGDQYAFPTDGQEPELVNNAVAHLNSA